MADAFDNLAAGDSGRLNINEPQEVSYWTSKLGVDEATLRTAVADVGVSTEAIRLHLGMAPSTIG